MPNGSLVGPASIPYLQGMQLAAALGPTSAPWPPSPRPPLDRTTAGRSVVSDSVTPWAVARQAALSMEFSR